MDLLYENYLLDNPQIEKNAKDRFENPFYDEMEKNLEVDINKIRLGNQDKADRPIDITVKPIKLPPPNPPLKEPNGRRESH